MTVKAQSAPALADIRSAAEALAPYIIRSSLLQLKSGGRSSEILLKHGIVTSSRSGNLRISAHFYNSEDDIHSLFRALREQKHLLV